MEKITIRQMKKADIKKLAVMYAEVYKVFDVGEKWDSKSAHKLLAYWFGRQSDLAFIAEAGGKLAGAAIAGIKPWWDGNHIVDGEIFVSPQFQKRGIGSMLLKALCLKAKKKYKAISFDTITFRSTGFPLSWYRKIGFDEVKEWMLISASVDKILQNLD
ncbi:MAG: GNAT family N-acetyltransferase [Candidatus Aenigmarchaeota archaeon]|nr:GNAT family N-acetyltransferase [Candidatus Aenigmarchaeota archaeon]